MQFPERFSNLPEYAFPRLRALLDHHPAGGDVLHMSIGEPKHAFPQFITDTIAEYAHEFGKYPPNEGAPELLSAIADWIKFRFDVAVDPSRQVLVLNGTREGLFNTLLACCPEQKAGQKPVVIVPNPFYQVYAVAGAAVGAEVKFAAATRETDYLPDFAAFDAETLNRTAVVYLCSPSNPQGAVASRAYWENLIRLGEKYDFQIYADECYSEIYRDTAPVGALSVAKEIGADPERVVIFHSLSKRSNLPGLRVGFAAGGPRTIAEMRQLRTYAGAPISLPLQRAATRAFADETHVVENRALYQAKYDAADEVFAGLNGYVAPQAGFFLWLPVVDGEQAALHLWQRSGVRVLPGAYLGREDNGSNPGDGYIRVAMVAEMTEMMRGLQAIRQHLY